MEVQMPVIWLFIVIAAGIFEAVTVDLVSIWFCVGGIVALILSYFGAALWLQITAFAVISAICICLTRPLAKKILRGNIVKTNSDRLIGKHAIVTSPISQDERGEVKIMGEYWSAISRENTRAEIGDHVEVLAIEGVKLIVRPLK